MRKRKTELLKVLAAYHRAAEDLVKAVKDSVYNAAMLQEAGTEEEYTERVKELRCSQVVQYDARITHDLAFVEVTALQYIELEKKNASNETKESETEGRGQGAANRAEATEQDALERRR